MLVYAYTYVCVNKLRKKMWKCNYYHFSILKNEIISFQSNGINLVWYQEVKKKKLWEIDNRSMYENMTINMK